MRSASVSPFTSSVDAYSPPFLHENTAQHKYFQESDQGTEGDITSEVYMMTAHSWCSSTDRGAVSRFLPGSPAAVAAAVASLNNSGSPRSSFTCSLCRECFRVDYYGRKPPFCPQLVFMEDVFCMKDPFSVGGGGGQEGGNVSHLIRSLHYLPLNAILYIPFARQTRIGRSQLSFVGMGANAAWRTHLTVLLQDRLQSPVLFEQG